MTLQPTEPHQPGHVEKYFVAVLFCFTSADIKMNVIAGEEVIVINVACTLYIFNKQGQELAGR